MVRFSDLCCDCVCKQGLRLCLCTAAVFIDEAVRYQATVPRLKEWGEGGGNAHTSTKTKKGRSMGGGGYHMYIYTYIYMFMYMSQPPIDPPFCVVFRSVFFGSGFDQARLWSLSSTSAGFRT